MHYKIIYFSLLHHETNLYFNLYIFDLILQKYANIIKSEL